MGLVTPTRLTEEQIVEFKTLYKKHYHIDLTDKQAMNLGVRFLQFLTIIIENNETFFDE